MAKLSSYFEGEKGSPKSHDDLLDTSCANGRMEYPAVRLKTSSKAVFNYFPITFTPPPDDPYGITAQDLKGRLRACIAATSYFAPYAFPALLDKLDSTSINTKVKILAISSVCIDTD